MPTLTNAKVIMKLKQHLKEGRLIYDHGDESRQHDSFQQAQKLAAENHLHAEEILFEGCLAFINGEMDAAYALLEKAYATNGLILKTNTLDCMAWVCLELENYQKVIEILSKVLEDEQYEMRGESWNNMGMAYSEIKEYTKAVECYQKALAEKSYDTPGDAWHNMGITYGEMGEHAKAIECFEKALAESYDSPGDAWYNMGISYGEMGKHTKAIQYFQKALAEESYNAPGDAWYNMGVAYAEMGKHTKAIRCLQKALAEESYGTPGDAWYNMGVAYGEIDEHDKSIGCYQKAIDESYDAPGSCWNNMGLTYEIMGEHSKAIECFQKALAEESYDTPGYAWNNMGIAYGEIGEHSKAIECFQKALAEESYDTPGNAWYNMALAFRDTEHFEDALQCLSEAEKSYRMQGQTEDLAATENLIKKLQGLIKSRKAGQEGLEQRYLEAAKLAEAVIATPKREGVVSEPTSKTFDARAEIDRIISNTTSTEEYRQRKHADLGNWLICLRGWSSSTNVVSLAHPEFYDGSKCCGGGFLLNWRKKAHIVDPGTDFLDTFCKFSESPGATPPHILQVHTVQTTHRHPDHTGDLAAITQLDADVAGMRDRKLSFYLDKDTYDSMPSLLKERQGRNRVGVRILEPDSPISIPGKAVTLDAFKVDHGNEAPSACGVTFELKQVTRTEDNLHIGFTGDTKWFPGLADKLAKCKIIVCNFSATRATDVWEKEFKKDHLGFSGLFELITRTKAGIYVVTEFWGQLGDIRVSISQYLLEKISESGRRSKDFPVIIPADVGLIIDVENLTVMCSHCQQFVPAEQIVTIPVTSAFGKLLYLCPRHLMKQAM